MDEDNVRIPAEPSAENGEPIEARSPDDEPVFSADEPKGEAFSEAPPNRLPLIVGLVVAALVLSGLWFAMRRSSTKGSVMDEVAAGSGAVQTGAEKPPPDLEIIEVNGESIRQSQFVAALESYPPQVRETLAGEGPRKVVAEELVRMKVLEQEARKMGLDKDPLMKGRLEILAANLLASAALERLASQAKPLTPQQLYEKNKSQFESVKARQIVIAFGSAPGGSPAAQGRTPEQAQAKAQQVEASLRSGKDFAALARTESDDIEARKRGGDMGSVGRGMLPPDIEKPLFELPVNGISSPIRSRYGFHVFQVTSRETKTFDQVKDVIQKQGQSFQARDIVEQLRAKAKVEFKPAFSAGAPSGGRPVQSQAPPSQ